MLWWLPLTLRPKLLLRQRLPAASKLSNIGRLPQPANSPCAHHLLLASPPAGSTSPNARAERPRVPNVAQKDSGAGFITVQRRRSASLHSNSPRGRMADGLPPWSATLPKPTPSFHVLRVEQLAATDDLVTGLVSFSAAVFQTLSPLGIVCERQHRYFETSQGGVYRIDVAVPKTAIPQVEELIKEDLLPLSAGHGSALATWLGRDRQITVRLINIPDGIEPEAFKPLFVEKEYEVLSITHAPSHHHNWHRVDAFVAVLALKAGQVLPASFELKLGDDHTHIVRLDTITTNLRKTLPTPGTATPPAPTAPAAASGASGSTPPPSYAMVAASNTAARAAAQAAVARGVQAAKHRPTPTTSQLTLRPPPSAGFTSRRQHIPKRARNAERPRVPNVAQKASGAGFITVQRGRSASPHPNSPRGRMADGLPTCSTNPFAPLADGAAVQALTTGDTQDHGAQLPAPGVAALTGDGTVSPTATGQPSAAAPPSSGNTNMETDAAATLNGSEALISGAGAGAASSPNGSA